MEGIVHGTFTSVWDGGYTVTTPCTVDMSTRQVFPDVYEGDALDSLEHLDGEYIEMNGEVYPVYPEDERAIDDFWYAF